VVGDRRREVTRRGVLGEDARLEVGHKHAELALGRAAGAAVGAREAVPRLGEADGARPPAAPMGGEHRTHAPASVGVGADDDVVGPDALEHRPPRGRRQALDRGAELVDGRAPGRSHKVCRREDGARTIGRRVGPGKAAPASERKIAPMKLGVQLGYWGLGLSADDQIAIVREAERAGYDSVWSAEAYGSDAATVLAWLAAQTETIKLGSAIFQIPGRSPALTAMTAATIDQLSGGRMLLGIGSSGPQVAEGWHGQRFARQIQRTREYIEVVRLALARERVEYHGETLELPLPDGPGKALKLTIGPVQERIRIFLAAIGPRNTALAGEIADGWLPFMFSPEHVDELSAPLREGAEQAGRSLDEVEIVPSVNAYVGDDREQARDLMRPILALYVGGMGSREKNFYNALVQRYGFEEAAREVQDLYLEGKREAAAAALPDALIDQVSLCGPRDEVRDRLRAYRESGVGTLLVTPMAFSREERIEQLRVLAELAEEAA
jgi:F420-dependent oxidoreductase-like protein